MALLERNPGPFYLSLDLDVLDPSVFPAVTNPEPMGIQVGELVDAINLLSGKLIAADIVEYNPQSCTDLHPAVTAAFLMRELSLCFEH
jgi:arginase family enzyme